MYYIAWPNQDLTAAVEGNPRQDSRAHVELLKRRQTELEQLRGQIVNSLDVPPASRAAVLSSIGVLPALGLLLLSDETINVELLSTRALGITIAPDEPLPPLEVPQAQAQMMTAQPWHITMIRQPGTLSGLGARIGVIDTGCGTTLPDLVAPFAPQFAKYKPPQPAQQGRPAQPPRMAPGPTPMDFGTHGSTVCAFLAGNQSGVAKGATVIVAAVPAGLPLSNRTMFCVALEWLIVTGCDIITTSLLTSNPGVLPSSSTSLTAVDKAIQRARDVHKIVVTAAIGNTGAVAKQQHPGSSAFAIGVGAVDDAGRRFGSAWGSISPGIFKPDIVAPGYNLQLPTAAGLDEVGGTSYATPIVAGALALILESDPTKRGNPAALTQKLLQLVQPVVPPLIGTLEPNSTGAGLLDLSSL